MSDDDCKDESMATTLCSEKEKKKIKRGELELEESSLEGIALYIKEVRPKSIIVISGGMISVPTGIPDFRSPDVGLYHAPIIDNSYGRDVFNKKYFMNDPVTMYKLLSNIFERDYQPTLSHYFIALLEKKNLLRRNYTQNMDDLEKTAGVTRLIQINGSFNEFSCIKCGKQYALEWMKDLFSRRRIPQCIQCAWTIKPDVTFYGEELPALFYQKVTKDFQKCELLIILGSTLSNEPLATILRNLHVTCPRLMVTEPYPYEFSDFDFYGPENLKDVLWIGNCDAACNRLAELLGWTEELSALVKGDQPEETEV